MDISVVSDVMAWVFVRVLVLFAERGKVDAIVMCVDIGRRAHGERIFILY